MIANNFKSVLQVTNVSSSTLYNLTVHVPEVPPFNHFIPFTINIDTQPTATLTTTPPSPAVDYTLVYVVVAVVIVVGIALVVLTILCLKRQQTVFTKTKKGKR